MMRKLLTLLLLVGIVFCAAADDRSPRKKRKKEKARTEQAAESPAPEQSAASAPDTQAEEQPAVEPLPTDITLEYTAEQVDSLVAAWRERQRQEAYEQFFERYILVDTTSTGSTPDSVYVKRLHDLVSPIQLPYNPIVRSYINRYVDPRYGTISRILGMSKYYFPLIEDELLKEGMPVELRALPIIESALSPTAVSRMGAVGLWQFMPSTGKSYGLEINSLVDERRDPVRSTQAACRFLKDLYAIYNDWTLAIAAYNCGPGNVNKAMAARAARPSGRFTTTCPPRRAATFRPSSARPTPTPTTGSTTSNPPSRPFRSRWIRCASTACSTSGRSPRRSTSTSRRCASSTPSTGWTSCRPRQRPIRS